MVAQRIPNWTWDEEVLTFELYLRLEKQLDDSHEDVIALSHYLRSLPLHPEHQKTEKFRNANGVARKIADIHTRGPDYEGVKTSGSRLNQEVWDRLGRSRREVQELADRIRRSASLLPDYAIHELDEASVDGIHRQGILRYRVHRHLERSPGLKANLLNDARSLSRTGHASCDDCGRPLERELGEAGVAILEPHDLRPLSGTPRTVDPSGCVLLCPTCHAIAHRIYPLANRGNA